MCKDVLAKLEEQESVIAELEDCIRDYSEKTKTLVIANLDMQRMENHHKYKRCSAMAKWCEAKVYNIQRKPLCDMDDHEGWQHDDEFWQRWHKRWLKLAEHFKEIAK